MSIHILGFCYSAFPWFLAFQLWDNRRSFLHAKLKQDRPTSQKCMQLQWIKSYLQPSQTQVARNMNSTDIIFTFSILLGAARLGLCLRKKACLQGPFRRIMQHLWASEMLRLPPGHDLAISVFIMRMVWASFGSTSKSRGIKWRNTEINSRKRTTSGI